MDTHAIDWSLLQTFVTVAEKGSLSEAAKTVRGSQPTMSRHILLLEEALGCRLFDRTKAGVSLTVEGANLLEHAHRMAEAASALEAFNGGSKQRLSGTVRITASNIVASYLLPDILTEFHQLEPDIQLEVIASDETSNLLRREADVAVRMYRPEQPDVITRKLGEMEIGAYAAKTYLERSGTPQNIEDILEHDVIGYDRSTLIIDGFRKFGVKVSRNFFAFRSDNQVLCWKMVVAGYGIGFNQIRIGDAEPRVTRLAALDEVGTMPVWLTAHADLKNSVRVRRVYDFLAEALKQKTR